VDKVFALTGVGLSVLPIVLYIVSMDIIAPSAFYQFLVIYGLMYLVALGSTAVLRFFREYPYEYDNTYNLIVALATYSALIIVMIVFNVYVKPATAEMELISKTVYTFRIPGSPYTYVFLPDRIATIVLHIFVAYTESALFNVLYPYLLYRYSPHPALGVVLGSIVPALTFGLLHYRSWGAMGLPNPELVLLPAIVAGFIMNLAYLISLLRGKSTALGVVIAHALYNMTVVLVVGR